MIGTPVWSLALTWVECSGSCDPGGVCARNRRPRYRPWRPVTDTSHQAEGLDTPKTPSHQPKHHQKEIPTTPPIDTQNVNEITNVQVRGGATSHPPVPGGTQACPAPPPGAPKTRHQAHPPGRTQGDRTMVHDHPPGHPVQDQDLASPGTGPAPRLAWLTRPGQPSTRPQRQRTRKGLPPAVSALQANPGP